MRKNTNFEGENKSTDMNPTVCVYVGVCQR